jgi:AcrR family transcriptional regulator
MARPLSEIAHLKVLDAAAHLVAERGIDAASMDAIAKLSGVSKATIYKHWDDKEALVLDVLSHINGLKARPNFDTGHLVEDIVAVLTYQPPDSSSELRQRITPHLVAYSATHAEFGRIWRHTVMEPPRRELRQILTAAIARGDLASDLDIEMSLALLLGPMLYAFVFEGKTVADRTALASVVASSYLRAFRLSKTTNGLSGVPAARFS